jgi:hypothetical protein
MMDRWEENDSRDDGYYPRECEPADLGQRGRRHAGRSHCRSSCARHVRGVEGASLAQEITHPEGPAFVVKANLVE